MLILLFSYSSLRVHTRHIAKGWHLKKAGPGLIQESYLTLICVCVCSRQCSPYQEDRFIEKLTCGRNSSCDFLFQLLKFTVYWNLPTNDHKCGRTSFGHGIGQFYSIKESTKLSHLITIRFQGSGSLLTSFFHHHPLHGRKAFWTLNITQLSCPGNS